MRRKVENVCGGETAEGGFSQVKRSMTGMIRQVILLWSLGSPLWAASQPGEGFRDFIYISDQRVVTAEIASETEVIVNYINLASNYELLEARNLLIVGAGGESYRGHVFKRDTPGDDGQLYEVSDLLEPKRYKGYSVLGNFRFESAPQKLYWRVGARFLELLPVEAQDFETYADRIGRLDLKAEDPRLTLYDAGFLEGLGTLYNAGSAEARRLAAALPELEPYPPVVLKSPAPRLPSRFSSLPDPVVVRVRVEVTPLGGLLNGTIDQGIDPELDQIALEVVRNSWVVLPAISEGETVGTEVVLQVAFER